MDELIKRFQEQIEEAINISSAANLTDLDKSINKVLILGMGGSGIAGKFVSAVSDRYGKIPIFTSNDYDIPSWVDEFTLVIASSYSGNTEETLEALTKLKGINVKIVSITSGGKLKKISSKSNFDTINIPDNWPAPRACFGYSFVAQLYVLRRFGAIDIDLENELGNALRLLSDESDSIIEIAKEIALRLVDKYPVIYSGSLFEPLSIRFKQQLNENAKTLAHHAVVPEMNHNELVGWAREYENIAVIFIRSGFYSERVNMRIELSKNIIIKYVNTMIEIEAKGDRFIQQLLYLVNITDWVSFYLAEAKGVDVMEIANINFLKEQLAKV